MQRDVGDCICLVRSEDNVPSATSRTRPFGFDYLCPVQNHRASGQKIFVARYTPSCHHHRSTCYPYPYPLPLVFFQPSTLKNFNFFKQKSCSNRQQSCDRLKVNFHVQDRKRKRRIINGLRPGRNRYIKTNEKQHQIMTLSPSHTNPHIYTCPLF